MPRVLLLSVAQNFDYAMEREKSASEKPPWPEQEKDPSVIVSVKQFLNNYSETNNLTPRTPSALGKDEDAVDCICGTKEDKYGELEWVQCDRCFIWQHQKCVGYDHAKEEKSKYYCERCDEFGIRNRPYTPEEAAGFVEELLKEYDSASEEQEVPAKKQKLSSKKHESPPHKKHGTPSKKKRETPTRKKHETPLRKKREPPARKKYGSPSKNKYGSPQKKYESPQKKQEVPLKRQREVKLPLDSKRDSTSSPVAPDKEKKRGRKRKTEASLPYLPAPKRNGTWERPRRNRDLMANSTRSTRPIIHESVSFSQEDVWKGVKEVVSNVDTRDFTLPLEEEGYAELIAHSKSIEMNALPLGDLIVDEDVDPHAPLIIDVPAADKDQSTNEQSNVQYKKLLNTNEEKNQEPGHDIVEEKKGRRFSLEEYKMLQKDSGRLSDVQKETKKSGFMPALDNATATPLPVIPLRAESKPVPEADLERYCFGASTQKVTEQFTTLNTHGADGRGTNDEYATDLERFNAERERERQKGPMSLRSRLDRQFGKKR